MKKRLHLEDLVLELPGRFDQLVQIHQRLTRRLKKDCQIRVSDLKPHEQLPFSDLESNIRSRCEMIRRWINLHPKKKGKVIYG